MNITPVSFHGIKVQRTNDFRKEQNMTINSADAQIKLYDELTQQIGIDKLDNNINSENYAIQQFAVQDSKIKVDKLTDIAKRQVNVVKNTIENIKEADYAYSKMHNAEGRIRKSNIHLNNEALKKIAGYEYEKARLEQEFINPVKREKDGSYANVAGSVLFFGPYNNGKSTITKAIAEATDCKIIEIYDDFSKEETFDEIKKEAENSEKQFQKDRTRTIIFIDEIDNLINEKSPVKEDFVDFIKNCSDKYHCTVFAATNHPKKLGIDFNEEVFPIRMSIDPADTKTKTQLVEFFFKEFPKENLDYEKIVSEIENKEKAENSQYNNGQIENICTEIGESIEYDKLTTPYVIEYIKNQIMYQPEITSELKEKFKKEYEAYIK